MQIVDMKLLDEQLAKVTEDIKFYRGGFRKVGLGGICHCE